MKNRTRILAALAGVLVTTTVQAQDVTKSRDETMIEILVRSYEAQPDPAFQFLLAESYARLGEDEKAIAALEIIVASDRAYLPPKHSPVWKLQGQPRFDAVIEKLNARLPQTRNGVERFRVDGVIAEGIAYDPVSQAFLLGDIKQRRIVAVAPDGSVSTLASNLPLQPFGMAVDADRRALWVATSSTLGNPNDPPKSELLKIDLSTGAIETFSNPSMVALNDVAIAADGDVYATDFGANTVWRLESGSATPTRFGDEGSVMFPNGIAIDPTGQNMFVAQGRRPVVFDLATAKAEPMTKPDDLDMLGTDGFYFHDGYLIGIQNVTNPGRIVEMKLSPDLTAIVDFHVVESANPAFDLPTTGAIAGSKLVVIANSQILSGAAATEETDPLILLEYDLTGTK